MSNEQIVFWALTAVSLLAMGLAAWLLAEYNKERRCSGVHDRKMGLAPQAKDLHYILGYHSVKNGEIL